MSERAAVLREAERALEGPDDDAVTVARAYGRRAASAGCLPELVTLVRQYDGNSGDSLFLDQLLNGTSYGSANRANIEWGEPIPLGPPNPEPYPVAALPGWLADHVESVADAVQVPPDLPLLLALSGLSVAAANKVRVTVRPGHHEPAHLWTATVLPPGSRKSPVFRHMTRPIFDYEAELADRTSPERRRAEDDREVIEKSLEQAKRDAAKATTDEAFGEARQRMHDLRDRLDRLDVPTVPRLIVSDATSEKLARLMDENSGRIGVLAPEGDIFRIMAGRYSGTVSFDHYKRAWTGDEPISDDRMGREGSRVRRPALTMGLTLQPSVLDTLESKEAFRGEGLLARFLYAVPESGIGRRLTGADVPPLNQEAARRYGANLRWLLAAEPEDVAEDGEFVPHELDLSSDARDELFAFERDVEAMLGPGGRLEHVRDWGAKLPGHVTRVAVLLHIAAAMDDRRNPWGSPVTGEAMASAIAIGRASIPHALQVFDALEADPDVRLARYLVRRLRQLTASQGDPPTKRDIFEAVKGKSGLGTVQALDDVLEVLEAHRLARVVEQPTEGPGRSPSPLVVPHPSLASDVRTIRKTRQREASHSHSANSANVGRGVPGGAR